MLDDQAMPDEWIIRVEEKDYGPADLETLREWRDEGRVLAENPARPVDLDPAAAAASAEEPLWTTARDIPGLFETVPENADYGAEFTTASLTDESGPPTSAIARGPRLSFGRILADTFRVYRKGFVQFFYLTLLVTLPWLCGQLSAFAVDASSAATPDLRTAAAAAFTLCMLLIGMAAWPVFVAGIQILTAELAAGRRAQISNLLPEILRFWPRVAILCIFVYLIFFLLILFAFGILAMLILGASSLVVAVLALGLLCLQVWLFGRFYINVLFWQQFAVLGDTDAGNALRQSKELARSGLDLPWYQRPMWRGVFIASLWIVFVILLYIGPEWSLIRNYYQTVTTTTDPQAVLEALRTHPPSAQFNLTVFGLGLLERLLRPLVGIAFVLLYLDSGASAKD